MTEPEPETPPPTAYHLLYEYGNCPLFLTVGRAERVAAPDEDGTMRVKQVMRLRYVYDERVEEGLYCARTLELLR